MIPKFIHACWLGDNVIPEIYRQYISGWKAKNPEYIIKIWKIEDFPKSILNTKYAKYCIEKKEYGFLSDYLRLIVLYKFGGIYFDVDVECLKSFDDLLDTNFFIGYIFDCSLGTAVIGSEKNNKIIHDLIVKLETDFDINEKLTVNNDWVTEYFIKTFNDFKLDGKNDFLNNSINIYRKDYFERIKLENDGMGGYSIHHCDGSWRKQNFARKYIKPIIKFFLGKKGYEKFTLKRLTKKQKFYSFYKKEICSKK